MSRLTFKEIVGDILMVSGDPEGFYQIENYQDLWEQLNSLTGHAITITDWKGKLIDEDEMRLHMEFTIEGNPVVLDFEFPNFLEKGFIDAINAHLAGDKRFVLVAPEGMNNFDQSYNFMYLTPEQTQTLVENEYAYPVKQKI